MAEMHLFKGILSAVSTLLAIAALVFVGFPGAMKGLPSENRYLALVGIPV